MAIRIPKTSYTIPCSSSFRDAINALAAAQEVNVADIARSILLVIPESEIRKVQDPGEPPADDREETTLKSGPSTGKLWRRKPRLQVRLRAGYNITLVRRALNLALQLNQAVLTITLEAVRSSTGSSDAPKPTGALEPSGQSLALKEEVDRLQSIVSALMFNPLDQGVTSLADARHIMGFAPSDRPDKAVVRARFRLLAAIHHPDGNYGSHQRMSQLNAAMDLLSRN